MKTLTIMKLLIVFSISLKFKEKIDKKSKILLPLAHQNAVKLSKKDLKNVSMH